MDSNFGNRSIGIKRETCMKFLRWTWKWEPRQIAVKKTFWQWLFRKPQKFVNSNQLYLTKRAVLFDSLIKLLEEVAATQRKGQSCSCHLKGGQTEFKFSVDKGRNKIAIQFPVYNILEAKKKIKMFKDLLETDVNGMLFDIADSKTGKTYEVVFNVVNKTLHAEYNRMTNTGG